MVTLMYKHLRNSRWRYTFEIGPPLSRRSIPVVIKHHGGLQGGALGRSASNVGP